MHTSAVVRSSAERLVVAATMGPTVHEVHAWRFRVVPGLIEVRADPDRFPATRDATGRRLHLSCGAALVNLRLAAAQLGHEAVVRLLPDSGSPALLATVRLAGRHRVTRAERLLYAAALRPANPRSVALHPVRPGQASGAQVSSLPAFAELAEAARLEGAVLHRCDEAPGRAVLTTRGAGPIDWLRAGQALQRVLLTSAARSVAVSFHYEEGAEKPCDTRRVVEPGDVPQVFLELRSALVQAPEDRQDERQRHWERVG
ncbi:hypothetical protein [Actinomadura sp. 9N407]|uniref:hypothetical protein n=1 Tax=Actinomadura sp. 9N407 TaxID=3375154 RepID=UPI00378D588B